MPIYTKKDYARLRAALIEAYPGLADRPYVTLSGKDAVASHLIAGLGTLQGRRTEGSFEEDVRSRFPGTCSWLLFELPDEELPRYLNHDNRAYALVCSWRLSIFAG